VARDYVMVQQQFLHGLVLQEQPCRAHQVQNQYAAACRIVLRVASR
jgi:hypothetical protein